LVLLLPKFLIIWLSILPILSVPYEGYSRNALYALNLISTFLLHQMKQIVSNNYIVYHDN